jgi:hypothetical protein
VESANYIYNLSKFSATFSKGKRVGARVVTRPCIATEKIYLLTIYDKGEKADLKPNELKEMIESLELEI